LKATDNRGASANSTTTVTVGASGSSSTPPPAGSYGTLVYQNGYDLASNVVTNQLGLGSWSSAIKKTGAGSFKSYVVAGGPNQSSGWRSEQQYGSNETPNEGVVEYDVYYEVPFASNGHSFQWHPITSGASATLALWHSGGKFQVVRSVSKGVNIYGNATMTIAAKKWYNMRWEYKFSTGTDGYVKLYIDNVLYYSALNTRTADGSGQYLKVGQNMFNETTSGTAYYDNLKVYRK
jgi:hypothetical protein